jgi:hypothetical protein
VLTPRPGRIEDIFFIDLPRPRAAQIIGDPKFGKLVLRIQRLLGIGPNH